MMLGMILLSWLGLCWHDNVSASCKLDLLVTAHEDQIGTVKKNSVAMLYATAYSNTCP